MGKRDYYTLFPCKGAVYRRIERKTLYVGMINESHWIQSTNTNIYRLDDPRIFKERETNRLRRKTRSEKTREDTVEGLSLSEGGRRYLPGIERGREREGSGESTAGIS